jgi:hypothetical protein
MNLRHLTAGMDDLHESMRQKDRQEFAADYIGDYLAASIRVADRPQAHESGIGRVHRRKPSTPQKCWQFGQSPREWHCGSTGNTWRQHEF